jgi:hypothetical protein
MVTLYTASSGLLTASSYNTVPLDTPEINTITGASIDTGADTFVLPVGVYTIKMSIGTTIDAVSDSNGMSIVGRLVNITDSDAVVTYFTPHTQRSTRDDDHISSIFAADRTIEVVVSETSTFQISVFCSAYDNDLFPRFFSGDHVGSTFLTAGVPVHALEIWKKKVVVT